MEPASEVVQIIQALNPIITLLLTPLIGAAVLYLTIKIKQLETNTNSIKDALVARTKELALFEGEATGKNKEKAAQALRETNLARGEEIGKHKAENVQAAKDAKAATPVVVPVPVGVGGVQTGEIVGTIKGTIKPS